MSRLPDSVSGDNTDTSEGADSRANNCANNGHEKPPTVAPHAEPMPADLRQVVERWADLPEPIRAAVVTLVQAAGA